MTCPECNDSPTRLCAFHARTDNQEDAVDQELDALRGEVLGLRRQLEEKDKALARAREGLKLAWNRLGRVPCDDLTTDPGLLVCRKCDVQDAVVAALSATDPAAPAPINPWTDFSNRRCPECSFNPETCAMECDACYARWLAGAAPAKEETK